MTSKFSAHGRAHFAIAANVVRLYVEGPWNQELVFETHQAMQRALLEMQHAAWGMLVIIEKSALCDPQAMAAIRKAATEEKAKTGRSVTAWVLPSDVEGASIMRALVKDIYAGINPVRVFEIEVEAERWVVEQLAYS
jgi:hypothetical protein